MTVKMLQRKASLEAGESREAPPEQDVPLSVPKKTRLYIEQTQREREQATEMHRAFQRDLCKLRLSTARAYVKMITDGQGPMSYSSGSALRLTAQVQGLGPRFKIKLSLQNTGSKAVSDLAVARSDLVDASSEPRSDLEASSDLAEARSPCCPCRRARR